MASFASALQQTEIVWNPAKLNAALLEAFRPSVAKAAAYSKTHGHLKGAGVSVKRVNATSLQNAKADMMPTGLGWVQEGGRKGGYPIFPGGTMGLRRTKSKAGILSSSSLEFGGRFYKMATKGGFSSTAGALQFQNPMSGDKGFRWFTFGGDMKSDPYIRPGAELWSSVYYKQVCEAILARRGFGKGNVR